MISEQVEKIPRSKADIAWKNAIEDFFPDMMALLFLNHYSKIDWTRGWRFLDKEFQAISLDNVDGQRLADKLVEVYFKSGALQWIYIHIEVQGDFDKNFEKRMFIYHYRIFEKYGHHPINCAILTDNSKSWRPRSYQFKFGESELFFKFHMLKLLDLEAQRDILEKSNNPFAAIVLMQLNVIRLKKSSNTQRFHLKLSELKKLFAKGYTKEKLRKLYYFIDGLICLPPDLKIKFKDEVYKLEEQNNMPYYVSSIEEIGIEKGRQQVALALLNKGHPIELISEVTGISLKELEYLKVNQVRVG